MIYTCIYFQTWMNARNLTFIVLLTPDVPICPEVITAHAWRDIPKRMMVMNISVCLDVVSYKLIMYNILMDSNRDYLEYYEWNISIMMNYIGLVYFSYL